MWEINVYVMDVGGMIKPNINEAWMKTAPYGRTQWDRLQQLVREGWELVNCVSIAVNQGATFQLLWTFKRSTPRQP
jgi:hypothetical protein